MKGTVYFFTGLSGAGKSTIGGLFHRNLKNTKPNVVVLDGDEIRPVFGEEIGYSHEDRLRWAGRIFRVCKMLSDQGIDVVVCSIAMYSKIRAWNRENIENYKEIYIKVTRETLLKRNQKGLYKSGKNVVGVDLPFDEPQSPDIVIQNDGDRTPAEIVQQLEEELYPHIVHNPVDNREYWDRYYQNHLCSAQPSPFAQYVATLIEPDKTFLELGCGNGRDALYFGQKGMKVTALDSSEAAIRELKEQNAARVQFICGDFIDPALYKEETYDYVYSRFTLHAINYSQEQLLLKNLYCGLRPGGKLFIEVRSIHDSLCGMGGYVERNAWFYDNHYRRFLVLEELVETLEKYGFMVEYAKESTGFAPYGNDDPPVIRVIAVKKDRPIQGGQNET